MLSQKVIISILAVLAAVSFPLYSGGITERKVLIHTGHTAPVSAITSLSDKPYLVTLGRDGRLLVLNTGTGKPVRNHMTGLTDSQAVIPDRKGETCAILSGSEKAGYKISVVNIMNGSVRFTREFSIRPVSHQYSETGKLLILTYENYPFISFLDSDTGMDRPVLSGLTDIYSMILMEGEDRHLTAYSPSGLVTIWKNFRSGGSLPVQENTLPDLSRITFLSGLDEAWYAARFQNSLVLMNKDQGRTITGIVTPTDPIILTAIDSRKWQAVLLTKNQGGYALTLYKISPKGFEPVKAPTALTLPPGSKPTAMNIANGKIWIGDSEGSLLRVDPESGTKEPLRLPSLIPWSRIVIRGDALFLNENKTLGALLSPWFQAEKGNVPEDLSHNNWYYHTLSAPVSGPLLPLGGPRILLVTGEGRDPEIISFNTEAGTIADSGQPGTVPLSAISDNGSFHVFTRKTEDSPVIRTTRNEKTLAAVSSLTLPSDLEFPAAFGSFTIGIRTLIRGDETETFLHAVPEDKPESALAVQLPFKTVTSLLTDPSENRLYILGQTDEGSSLLVFSPEDLYKPLTLAFMPNEKPSGFRTAKTGTGKELQHFSLLLSEDRRTVSVFAESGDRWNIIESGTPVTDFQCSGGRVLFLMAGGEIRVRSLMSDSSEPDLFLMYFFKGGDWLAVSPEGEWVLASPEVVKDTSKWITLYKESP